MADPQTPRAERITSGMLRAIADVIAANDEIVPGISPDWMRRALLQAADDADERAADPAPAPSVPMLTYADALIRAEAVFDRWRVQVGPGGFSHQDGLRFLRTLREVFTPSGLPTADPSSGRRPQCVCADDDAAYGYIRCPVHPNADPPAAPSEPPRVQYTPVDYLGDRVYVASREPVTPRPAPPTRQRPMEHCGFSTGIDGGITAGRGRLDQNGYWELPCDECSERANNRAAQDQAAVLAYLDEHSRRLVGNVIMPLYRKGWDLSVIKQVEDALLEMLTAERAAIRPQE